MEESRKDHHSRKGHAHVVMVPYPSQGHINPLLQFAKHLAFRGIKATLATTRYTVPSISTPYVGVEPISDGFDDSGFAQAGSEDVYLSSFKANGSRTLSEIIRKFKSSGFPVDCVVYDSFLPWALDVAREHGIYGASFFTNSAAVSAVFSMLHDGKLSLPLKLDESPLQLPGLPPLYSHDLPSFLKAPGSYPAYLSMKLSQFSNLEDADWVFGNTFEALEGEVAGTVSEQWPAKLIGPMVPSAYLDERMEEDKGYGASLWKPLGEECMKWLESKARHSVAYVSFGSMVALSAEQMEEVAWGLKGSEMNFIWVVRGTELGKLPSHFIESTREKGMVVTWCNQLEMLGHGAVGCFVTHSGWNSTLEGLSLGVPMVGVPKWADQLTDAKFIEGVWRVGVRAKEDYKGIVTRDELIACLKQVMGDGDAAAEMRANAAKWKALAREAMSQGGSSDGAIAHFVHHLINKNNAIRPEVVPE
ncbi:UDP-glycosyltransferase 74B1-like [Diospyros lotus]|uniref:UDP-glycosyltransferase 74B1-like n=1 Tax=Diospyros lotus TaxID=55363 RepID=UPI00225C3E75|nr:UDP-glycosyltransferase 74B1-like [Diospyros lotus]